MIYGLGAYRYWNEFGRQSPWAVAGLLLGLVCTVGFLMPVHVLDRIFSGAIGAYIWFTQGVVTDGSVSFRLELWRMAWYAFLESPLLGLSSDEIFSRMKTLVDAGVLNEPALLQYPTIDSQFFGDLAEGGLLGLSSTVALLICPLVAFARFRHHQNLAVRELGLVAVWVCLLFAEFGLSASLWGQSTYRQFYVSWLLLLLGLIAVELSKATEPAHEA
jgi:O-antigen ligase